MAHVLVFVLPLAAAIAVTVAGMIYSTQKITSIWLVFGAVVICAIAACLYWQQAVITGADNPPFAVSIETAWLVEKRDAAQVLCEYNQKFVSPVPIVLFIRVVNLQNIQSVISQLKIEVELKKRWIFPNAWLRTVHVPESLRLIWFNAPPKPSLRLSLIGPRLEPMLKSKPLQPHETVSGWVLLDVSAEFDSAVRPFLFRISLQDTAGHRFSSIDSGLNGEDNVSPDRGFHTGDPIELKDFQFHHFADPAN